MLQSQSNTKYLMLAIAALFGVGVVCATVLTIVVPDNANTINGIGGMVLIAAGFLLKEFRDLNVEKKLDENTAKTMQAAAAAVETKQVVNGRMEELLREAKAAAFAEGVIAGKAESADMRQMMNEMQKK